jgi:hypothetical protein
MAAMLREHFAERRSIMAKYPFTKAYVDSASDTAGVYTLFDGSTIIYYGRAQGGTVTIRSRLQSHLGGYEGSCTQSATHFSAEPCTNPVRREEELLNAFKRTYGRLPRCNSRVG